MTHRENSYYPRRANVWSPLLARADAFGRGMSRFAFHFTGGVTFPGLIAAILVPGLAVYFRNPDRSGKSTIALCAILLLVFVAFLGFPVANAAFTIVLCIHVVGLVAYCTPMMIGTEWPNRFVASLALCLMIGLVYLPLQQFLTKRVVVPLRVHGHVVVVHRMMAANTVHRGDWIAFNVANTNNFYNYPYAHGRVIVHDGIELAQVLAVAGDQIGFDAHSIYINGVGQPRDATMPTSGGLVVPDHCWFAWPDFAMEGHGAIPPSEISGALMGIATVTPERFVGKVFKHWFGRRQQYS